MGDGRRVSGTAIGGSVDAAALLEAATVSDGPGLAQAARPAADATTPIWSRLRRVIGAEGACIGPLSDRSKTASGRLPPPLFPLEEPDREDEGDDRPDTHPEQLRTQVASRLVLGYVQVAILVGIGIWFGLQMFGSWLVLALIVGAPWGETGAVAAGLAQLGVLAVWAARSGSRVR